MSMMIRKAQVQKKGRVLGEWSDVEKKQLRDLVEKFGKDFGLIASKIGAGKTPAMVEGMWNVFKWRLGLSEAYEQFEKNERPTKAIKVEEEADAVSGRKILAETLDVRTSPTGPVAMPSNVGVKKE